MKLPDNSVGVTDIISWRDCARRMSFGMRRHTEAGEHPEAQSVSTAYGSAFHDAASYQGDNDSTVDEAVQWAFDLHARWLEPDDMERLKGDLDTYLMREPLNVVPVAIEREVKIPLFVYQGEQIYFRGRLDRLYQSTIDPTVFIHRDYKTSRHRKSEDEVHADVQMWAYNWAIHEEWPECETLLQDYDQLRFGVVRTAKSNAQRASIKEWLQRNVLAMLRDDKVGPDGLLTPTRNQWCPWCALMESCPVVKDATEFARVELAALAPQRKEGQKTVVDLDVDLLEAYVDLLPAVKESKAILERFDESMTRLLKEMPQQRRAALGYTLSRPRTVTSFPLEAKRAMVDMVGLDAFLGMVSVSQRAIDSAPVDDATKGVMLGMGDKLPGASTVRRAKTK